MGVDSSEAHLGEGPCGLQSLAGRDRCPGPACLGLTLCPARNDPVEVRGHATINFYPVKKPEESRHRVEASPGVPFKFPTRLHYGQHELRMYKKNYSFSFYEGMTLQKHLIKNSVYGWEKNKEREDEKETKDPYLNTKFTEPSMSQLFSLPRPKVFRNSLLPTAWVLHLYLLKLLLIFPGPVAL